ncbi:DUF2759 family protein [Paenibacillus sp. N10]|uniref:DUF2759 family protein n=1 Tax=Paenibacillus lutrae TaxID=2078573 RepID=A0A7X3K135_9BACL|nr:MULTISPECIES: DUF2759 family protein [Paenibacillus]MVP01581.1 DUF2759 family protein [Paenibacillus lutrae]
MYIAEEAEQASTFSGFDPFVIIFTILIAIGLFRLFKAPQKNVFAIGFAIVSLAVFLFIDVIMIKGW